MSKYHDKALERLVFTLTKLSHDERPTIEELAEEYNVSIRTIQRDLKRLMYFPIQKDSLNRLKFIDGYSLSKTTFEDEELLVTYLSLSQFKNINKKFDKNIDKIFSKILYPGYHSIFYIKPESFEKLDPDSEKIDMLEKAIENKTICNIEINNTKLIVEPHKIISLDGIWYLLANDSNNCKIKSFLLSKIETIELSCRKFKSKKSIDKVLQNVHSGFFEDGSSITVTIKVFPQVSHYFKIKKFLPTQKLIKEEDDKSLIVAFNVTHYEDIDNIIKAWIPHVKVLEPLDYKMQLIDELKEYMQKLIETT